MSEIAELLKKYMEQGIEVNRNLFGITEILEKRIKTLETKMKALEAGKDQ